VSGSVSFKARGRVARRDRWRSRPELETARITLAPDTERPNEALHACVGVEVEFTGLSARDATLALHKGLAGEIFEEDPHAYKLQASDIGDIWVELDVRHAHPQRHGAALTLNAGRTLSSVLGTLITPFAPREMILSPRPVSDLGDVDRAVAILRGAGAKGDGRILFDTLGLHFNVSTEPKNIANIRATTLAFARLDPHLRTLIAEEGGQRQMRLAPAFPKAYVQLLESRSPDQDPGDFIDDYLACNPTRDRALDLLPLLLHLDGPRVRRRLPYEKISPRPVFHWRLPVARVGRQDWSILPTWQAWLNVEDVAAEILRRGD
jgi:hypothetical protein